MNINDDDLFDTNGFLLPSETWSREIAQSIAKRHSITLTNQHWMVIQCLQGFYQEYEIIPTNRALITIIKKQSKEFSSIDFQELFSSSPIQVACQISGLPKPERCI